MATLMWRSFKHWRRTFGGALFAFVLGTFTVYSPLLAEAQNKEEYITAQELTSEIRQKIDNVEEFHFIREQAEKMGIRAYLFGGAAMAMGMYTKWDLERRRGIYDYPAAMFDYDLKTIFSRSQDFDIVIDGSKEQLERLQELVRARYPYKLERGDSAWEFRPLREPMGQPNTRFYKEALLNDYSFLNQNSDTASTGLIEVTRSADPCVRDIRTWNDPDNPFLKYMLMGKIKILRSPNHKKTQRYKDGQNPEIMEVVRAITKSAQYQIKFTDDSWADLEEISRQFNPNEAKDNGVAYKRLLELGKKIFKGARSIEYASDVLKRLGLSQKLSQFDDPKVEGSLAWYLSKEPLRLDAVGRGNGRTAKELGLGLLSHDTKTPEAAESISRNIMGFPNAFVSRDGVAGERGKGGVGWYLRRGPIGQSSILMKDREATTYTVHVEALPNAREGSDFDLHWDGQAVVVKNKAAFRIIIEGPYEMLKYLKENGMRDEKMSRLVDQYVRKLRRVTPTYDAAQGNKLAAMIADEFEREQRSNRTGEKHLDVDLINLWFSMPISTKYPHLLEALVEFDRNARPTPINRFGMLLKYAHWKSNAYFLNHAHWREATDKLQWLDGQFIGDKVLKERESLMTPAAASAVPPKASGPSHSILTDLSSPDLTVVSRACADAKDFRTSAVANKLMDIIETQIKMVAQDRKPNTYILNAALNSLGKMMEVADSERAAATMKLFESKKSSIEAQLGKSYKYTLDEVNRVKARIPDRNDVVCPMIFR
jgi:hypothetical protein